MDIIEAINRLKVYEGFRSHAYQDHLGWWTIGYGRLVDKRKGGGISKEEAAYLLKNDAMEVTKALDRRVPWWAGLPEPAMEAIFDMTFNMGVAGFLDGWPNTWRLIEQRKFLEVADIIRGSKYAQQVGQRAEDNAKRFETAQEFKR